MIRMTSIAALALFVAMTPSTLIAQNAPSSNLPPPRSSQLPVEAAKTSLPKPVEGQITTQDPQTVLASNLLGAKVYSPDDQVIGDVSDLIIEPKGEVAGVVIGVGGFLGIGEKSVAIATSRVVTSVGSDHSSVKLVLNATKDDLKAAPAFKSAWAQEMEKEQLQAERLNTQTDPQTGLAIPRPPQPSQPQ